MRYDPHRIASLLMAASAYESHPMGEMVKELADTLRNTHELLRSDHPDLAPLPKAQSAKLEWDWENAKAATKAQIDAITLERDRERENNAKLMQSYTFLENFYSANKKKKSFWGRLLSIFRS